LRKGLLPSLISILPGSQACRGRSSNDQGQSTGGRVPALAHMRARASIDRRRTTLCSTGNYRSFASSALLSWVSCFVLGIRVCTPGLACIRWGFSCASCQLSFSCNQAVDVVVETPLSGFNARFSGSFGVCLLSQRTRTVARSPSSYMSALHARVTQLDAWVSSCACYRGGMPLVICEKLRQVQQMYCCLCHWLEFSLCRTFKCARVHMYTVTQDQGITCQVHVDFVIRISEHLWLSLLYAVLKT
jgi:hypothetical protein